MAPGDPLLHDRLLDKIGEVGMGAVWRAADTDESNLIAVDGDRFLFQVPAEEIPPRTITVVVGWERLPER